jgi:hypothetical protein
MTALRVFLVAVLVAVVAYTVPVFASQGPDLYTPFFGAILEMTWQGQFNFDFLFMLAMSGLWVSWRHRFSPAGLLLGLCAFLGGSPFLCVYLLVTSARTGGNAAALLLGPSRA